MINAITDSGDADLVEQFTNPERPRVGLLDYILTLLFGVLFFVLLVSWDLVQRCSFYVFGEKALHRVARTLNWLILSLLRITGARYQYVNPFVFSSLESFIVVSNHQSMFDICLVHEPFWRLTPRFISKVELGRWIPGISFNLRSGGHPLIDRSSSSQALAEIIRLGRRLHEEHFATVIFPEGTRARDGVLKKFKTSGVNALLRKAPNAKVAVVAIDGSWRFQTYNLWPIPRNSKVQIEVVDVLNQSDFESSEKIIETAEQLIAERLKQWRA